MTLMIDDGVRQVVRLLRESRDYFAFARDESQDPEMARVFGRAARSRNDLLEDLIASCVVPANASQVAAPLPDVEHGYAKLRSQFDPQHPEVHAEALFHRECHLVRLMEEVFRTEASQTVRSVLKANYRKFLNCAQSMHALSLRHQAA
jgi:hypothetical protein